MQCGSKIYIEANIAMCQTLEIINLENGINETKRHKRADTKI